MERPVLLTPGFYQARLSSGRGQANNRLPSSGPQVLTFSIHILPPDADLSEVRKQNLALAKADPQAVFRGDCAKCHAEPTKGKLGKPLYQAACAICHEAEHRASMVPDLTKIPLPKYPQRWQHLIATGKPGTPMPALYKGHGGPLTAEQVRSLVEFMGNESTKN